MRHRAEIPSARGSLRQLPHGALDYTVPKEVMFADHTYRSGTTKSLRAHFKEIATKVHLLEQRTGIENMRVLDIGSNDGTQLQCFKDLRWQVLGVESCVGAAADANAAGIETLNAFFDLETAKTIGLQFDVINAAGVFFHLEDLHSVCDGVRYALKPDGVFVIQFIYAKSMMANGAFDQIYHEHLLYYTLKTVGALLALHGLQPFDAFLSPIHGGSIIAFAGHMGRKPATTRLNNLWADEHNSGCNDRTAWEYFARGIADAKERNLAKLAQWKNEGKRVYGMGAAVKTNTLLNTFGIKNDLIQYLAERNPLRKGLYSPGSHIEIVMEDEIEPPDVWFVGAWNFRKEILERNKNSKAEFYFPIVVD